MNNTDLRHSVTVDEWIAIGEKHRRNILRVVPIESPVTPGKIIPAIPLDKNISILGPLPFGESYFSYRLMLDMIQRDNGKGKDIIHYYENGGGLSSRKGYVMVRRGMISGLNLLTSMS